VGQRTYQVPHAIAILQNLPKLRTSVKYPKCSATPPLSVVAVETVEWVEAALEVVLEDELEELLNILGISFSHLSPEL
jgi:hypothetical protein